MNKVLIVGPNWVGDMVMAQCLFQLLKQRHPNVLIDVLAPLALHSLLHRMPEVRKPIVLPFKHGELQLRKRYQIAKELRHENYEHAIILPHSFKSALIPFWANIPKRTGWLGEYRWGLLNDVRYLDKTKLPLMIERFVALGLNPKESPFSPIPWPRLQVSLPTLEATLQEKNLHRHKPILALCPGAEFGPSKRWPPSYYAVVAKEKLAEGWQVWILGGPQERYLANEIQQASDHGCIDLTGRTTLGEAIDLLSIANAVVSNDSGLMHIAAALQRPLIAIYGSSEPRHTPPLSKNAKVLSLKLECSPCFKRTCPLGHWRCIRELYPNEVIKTLNEMSALTPLTGCMGKERSGWRAGGDPEHELASERGGAATGPAILHGEKN